MKIISTYQINWHIVLLSTKYIDKIHEDTFKYLGFHLEYDR